jgi:hypothetical protein
VLGATHLRPQGKKLEVDMQTGTLTDEALWVRVDRIVRVQRIETLVFLVVIWAVTVKPGG